MSSNIRSVIFSTAQAHLEVTPGPEIPGIMAIFGKQHSKLLEGRRVM